MLKKIRAKCLHYLLNYTLDSDDCSKLSEATTERLIQITLCNLAVLFCAFNCVERMVEALRCRNQYFVKIMNIMSISVVAK